MRLYRVNLVARFASYFLGHKYITRFAVEYLIEDVARVRVCHIEYGEIYIYSYAANTRARFAFKCAYSSRTHLYLYRERSKFITHMIVRRAGVHWEIECALSVWSNVCSRLSIPPQKTRLSRHATPQNPRQIMERGRLDSRARQTR